MNVCLAEDSVFDPWYSLGNGKLLRVLDAGLHICQMMGYQDISKALSLITDNSARALGISDRYGIEVGKPANLIILSGSDDYEVVRRQEDVRWSIRKGEVILQRQPASLVVRPGIHQ